MNFGRSQRSWALVRTTFDQINDDELQEWEDLVPRWK